MCRAAALWIAGGVAAGIAGAAIVAGCAEMIAAAVNGIGQELFNAAILFTAVAMLGWHNIWMNRHGRELAASAAGLGRAVVGGSRPLYALGLVVGIAVLREGSEVVLFLYGIAVASGVGALSMLVGGVLGMIGGVAHRHADLLRAARDPDEAAVCRDQLADPAVGGGHGVAGRGIFDAGQSAAVARQRSVGHLVDPRRAQHARHTCCMC